jgi:L-alanine-DL-glutamate epimerase-like enolase superfamily enzyme
MARRSLDVRSVRLRLKSPFRISGYVFEATDAVVATVAENGHRGRGEASGVYYTGDDLAHMLDGIEKARNAIEAGADRAELQALLPPGGARNALDCALWELEAAQQGVPVWQLAGIDAPKPVVTTFTVGAEPAAQAVAAAFAMPGARAIKIKLSGEGEADIERVESIRAARPEAWIGVDANQGYDRRDLPWLVEALQSQNVALLEQPLRRGAEADLADFRSPIPIAADESILSLAELPGAVGRFDVINIKLDKCGGLTEGLAIAAEARRLGLGVMVGNMVGTSLAMAPAFVLAQLCDFVDLDGPTFLAEDVRPAVTYEDGRIWCGESVWGGPGRLAA